MDKIIVDLKKKGTAICTSALKGLGAAAGITLELKQFGEDKQ